MVPATEQVRKYKQAMEMVRPFIDMTMSIETVGLENIPQKGGALLVGNHRSDLDPLVISANINRFVVFIAAHYVFKIPFVGKYLEELGTIPISAAKTDQINAFRKVSYTLKKDRILGIFPEGHDYIVQNDFSQKTARFHSGFARFSLKLKKPVIPAAIIGIDEHTTPIPVPGFVREMLGFPKEVLHVKNRLIYKKAKVVYGKPIDWQLYKDYPLEDGVRKMTTDTHEIIQELIHNHAPIERRAKDGGRRSGTRVSPEEVPGRIHYKR